jgi:hypothetical protein
MKLDPNNTWRLVEARLAREKDPVLRRNLELACDRVIVDEESVFTEGVMRMAYPGATLRQMGIEVDDPDAYYLYETRMGVVWPVDPSEGKLIGEESYTGGDGFAGIEKRKLSLDDVVALESE